MSFLQDLQDDLVLRDKDCWVPAFGITICVSLTAAGSFAGMPWLAFLNLTVIFIALALYVILALAFMISSGFVFNINPRAHDAAEDLQRIILVNSINHPRLAFNVLSVLNITLLHYIGGFPGPLMLGSYVVILLSTKYIRMQCRQVLKEKLRA